MFVYSLDYARTRLANDLKSTKKGGGERQYSGLVDVYRQTLKSDGIAGLYRGFVISCVGIIVYRGFYFGLFDTIRPLLPENSPFIVTFSVGYAVTGNLYIIYHIFPDISYLRNIAYNTNI